MLATNNILFTEPPWERIKCAVCFRERECNLFVLRGEREVIFILFIGRIGELNVRRRILCEITERNELCSPETERTHTHIVERRCV